MILARLIRPFGRLADLKGRDCRRDFWPFMGLLIAIAITSLFVMPRMPFPAPWGVLPRLLLALLLTCLGWAATVRRLHDGGWSGWWMHVSGLTTTVIAGGIFYAAYLAANGACPLCFGFIGLVPWLFPLFLGQLVLWAVIGSLCLLDGSQGPNRYGPDLRRHPSGATS